MTSKDMRDTFILSRWCHILGEPYLSDIEYDKLECEFKEEYPDDPYSKRRWNFDPCPTELLARLGREDLIVETKMGYMAESMASLTTMQEVNEVFNGLNSKTRMSFKIDGWNTKASYYNGNLVSFETRGRSGSAKDIQFIPSNIPTTIPIMGRVAATGELSIPNNKWNMYKLMTGNSDQRASVSSCIARGDVEFVDFLAFNIFIENGRDGLADDDYVILKELGFSTVYYKDITSYPALLKTIDHLSMLSSRYNYLSDGIVVENKDCQYAIRVGAWQEKCMTSYVEGYQENYGMYGNSLVLLVRPTSMVGKTFSKVTITNIANIYENELMVKSPIAFNLRSEANSVLDVTETFRLQKAWEGRYEEYCNMIDEREFRLEQN